jgi:hypothetical protein
VVIPQSLLLSIVVFIVSIALELLHQVATAVSEVDANSHAHLTHGYAATPICSYLDIRRSILDRTSCDFPSLWSLHRLQFSPVFAAPFVRTLVFFSQDYTAASIFAYLPGRRSVPDQISCDFLSPWSLHCRQFSRRFTAPFLRISRSLPLVTTNTGLSFPFCDFCSTLLFPHSSKASYSLKSHP